MYLWLLCNFSVVVNEVWRSKSILAALKGTLYPVWNKFLVVCRGGNIGTLQKEIWAHATISNRLQNHGITLFICLRYITAKFHSCTENLHFIRLNVNKNTCYESETKEIPPLSFVISALSGRFQLQLSILSIVYGLRIPRRAVNISSKTKQFSFYMNKVSFKNIRLIQFQSMKNSLFNHSFVKTPAL